MSTLKRLVIAVAAFGAVFACGPRNEGLDASKIPADLRGDYQLFTVRCSKCHSLARPLSAGITDDQQWVDYVNRMRRQPASGISYEDQAHILRFLKWYAAELRHQQAAKNADPSPPASSSSPPPPPAPAAVETDGGQ